MSSINSVNIVDNVTPAETIKSGFDDVNQHWHEYDGVQLTNSAAGSTAVGDVLAQSSATAILGDTVSSLQKYVVAEAVIANAATGEFARGGVVSAKANGAIAAMQYVRKSATARSIEDAGVAVGATASAPQGAVGFAMAAASGGFCTIFLFDKTATGVNFKLGSFTRDLTTASGTQAVTGVGFTPRLVLFLAGGGDGNVAMSVGWDDGTTVGAVDSEANAATEAVFITRTTASINLDTVLGSQSAIITTFEADGFTLTWTKTGSPTGTVTLLYLAFG